MRTLLAMICVTAFAAVRCTPASAEVVYWANDVHWVEAPFGPGIIVYTSGSSGGGFPANSHGPFFPADTDNPFIILPSPTSGPDVIGFYDYEPWSWTNYWDLPSPQLTVHPESKLVEVTMDWPTPRGWGGQAWAQIETYMLGLAGSFGPLEPGLWQYRGRWSRCSPAPGC